VDSDSLHRLLVEVSKGAISPDEALGELRDLPFRALGSFANFDTHRHLRSGFPEVIYGPGKTVDQLVQLLEVGDARSAPILATRIAPEVAAAVRTRLPEVAYHPVPRMLVKGAAPAPTGRGTIAVLSAGTSDLPVAEEAALTAELAGNRVVRVVDVGVAGLHRLLAHRNAVESAEIVVVVAGMDGALPTVVAGLFCRPVIAVPTSVGYGASFGGIAPLLTMLNACAAGIAVVNIDNGFGAGRIASLLNREPRTHAVTTAEAQMAPR